MWVRKRLDVGWADLAFGVVRPLLPLSGGAIRQRLDGPWSGGGDTLACLSVRSGFDLLLGALELPPGSEVLMSALTIPGMLRIVEHHRLVAVPVDLDPGTMAPTPASLHRVSTSSARLVVVAHLFGSRVPMEPILEITRARSLLVVEDCAQAFDGTYRGHPNADVSMFSFGPIKTATALGGGLIRVREVELLQRMSARQANWPAQSRSAYLGRVVKYSALKIASCRPALRAWVRACEATGRDFDRMANSSARTFSGTGFFGRIRRRPSAPLVAMIDRRLRNFDRDRLARRIAKGQLLAGLLGGNVVCPAAHTVPHTYWVFPILVENPGEVIASLRLGGFDATQGVSMLVVPPPPGRPGLRAEAARQAFSRLVYLPLYPEMPDAATRKMAEVVLQIAKPATCLGIQNRAGEVYY